MMNEKIQARVFKIPDRREVYVGFYKDGSGFTFGFNKNVISEPAIHLGIDVIQALIEAYNQYREELKNNNQLHDSCKVITPVELELFDG